MHKNFVDSVALLLNHFLVLNWVNGLNSGQISTYNSWKVPVILGGLSKKSNLAHVQRQNAECRPKANNQYCIHCSYCGLKELNTTWHMQSHAVAVPEYICCIVHAMFQNNLKAQNLNENIIYSLPMCVESVSAVGFLSVLLWVNNCPCRLSGLSASCHLSSTSTMCTPHCSQWTLRVAALSLEQRNSSGTIICYSESLYRGSDDWYICKMWNWLVNLHIPDYYNALICHEV